MHNSVNQQAGEALVAAMKISVSKETTALKEL